MEQGETAGIPVRLAFSISYIGSGFYGSQVQPDVRTVEGDIKKACEKADLFPGEESGHLLMSGRTDRGVHARRQIIALTTPYPKRAILVLNNLLSPDIQVNAYAVVDADFHPRYVPSFRTYRYYGISKIPDPDLIQKAASLFVGTHTYQCFAKMEGNRDPVRTVFESSFISDNTRWYYEIRAESFLWHMVRGIVTALLWCRDGLISPEEIAHMLQGTCSRRIPPADPTGLILWDVDCALNWIPLPVCKRSELWRLSQYEHHLLMAFMHQILAPQEGTEKKDEKRSDL